MREQRWQSEVGRGAGASLMITARPGSRLPFSQLMVLVASVEGEG